jgi:hypothetical protein
MERNTVCGKFLELTRSARSNWVAEYLAIRTFSGAAHEKVRDSLRISLATELRKNPEVAGLGESDLAEMVEASIAAASGLIEQELGKVVESMGYGPQENLVRFQDLGERLTMAYEGVVLVSPQVVVTAAKDLLNKTLDLGNPTSRGEWANLDDAYATARDRFVRVARRQMLFGWRP